MSIEQILNDPKFQKTLKVLAEQKGETLEAIQQEAGIYLKELYTEQKPIANLIGIQAIEYILSRGYDRTIDVNAKEIKELTKLMRRHPIAFVMTHKTYIDMFVLMLVLARHGLPIPYVFAGINMSFMGMGYLGRQTGAIFIRRSFKDNHVYKATLRHFIATVINNKGSFMWAIEGTRSRTGKLVWPKMGILKYILEGERYSKQSVKYVPVSIVYDLIPDVKDMTEEGRGKIKQAETLSWFMRYVRKMGEDFGKISLRFGEPVKLSEEIYIPDHEDDEPTTKNEIPRFAFELVHNINQITPVTTASLICTSILSQYALTKRSIESSIADLMPLVESRKQDALVDRGKPIGESVQIALNLLKQAEIVQQQGEGVHAKYTISPDQFLQATYYTNMAAHHLYHRAFVELALVHLMKSRKKTQRRLAFWTDIMQLRDLFKFEFFYSTKPTFSDEIEQALTLIEPNWVEVINGDKKAIKEILDNRKVIVAPAVLFTYIEAYRVIAQALKTWNPIDEFSDKRFIDGCLLLGGEMHWQGHISRIESVSKPFLVNGLRLAKNRRLIPTSADNKQKQIDKFIEELDDLSSRIKTLQSITLEQPTEVAPAVPLERDVVPGSRTEAVTQDIMSDEEGAHIGAFFDLDRTLIRDFSAKEFMQGRLLSGKVTAREILSQFAGVIVYAIGQKNFAGLAALSAQGIKGVKEQEFIELGEEVYLKHLADSIYPESRALVAAHLAKGHTVAIISAATPYQVNPIARDLGIEHVMCTRMEVKNGKFTGSVVEPACWGDGKAYAAKELAKEYNLDLSKSYFYTDSAEDMPLLEIVGNPIAMNPDMKLSATAFQNNWPVYRFNEKERPGLMGIVRTSLAMGSMIPAAWAGVLTGATNQSWTDGVNSMMATFGDLGTAMAGLKISIKGEENLWLHRPAVFLFNHQSSADLFIVAKLLRKDARAIAKKELKNYPILGQLLAAGGIIFVDRANREKAIEALKPAVEALKSGTSIAIAPEGTRSYDKTLGKFKKGAFHLAIQGKVPIVPIVIKNAHDAMPRGTSVFRPTLIEVVVLDAFQTTDWTTENLDEHIKTVRDAYLKELGQIE